MDNNTLQLKFQGRLNKLASQDYDNLECWQIAEAFNKAQLEWTRRQIAGLNQRQVADEGDKQIKEDLQVLYSEKSLDFVLHPDYAETEKFPEDYHLTKRVDVKAKSSCCGARPMRVYPCATSDVTARLRDENARPDFEWAETFYTLGGNRLRVYRTADFDISEIRLTSYHKPREVSFLGCISTKTGLPLPDVTCEFRDDVTEIIIDEAVSTLAGDIENQLQMQRSKQAATSNT